MGLDEGTHDQWDFPKCSLSDLDKRLILATVMKIAVLTMFNSHMYTSDNAY